MKHSSTGHGTKCQWWVHIVGGCKDAQNAQIALEGQDLPCMYLAHHVDIIIIIIIIIVVIITAWGDFDRWQTSLLIW